MNKLKIAGITAAIVLSGSMLTIVSANVGFWDNVAQRVANGLLGKVTVPSLEQEQSLGAVVDPSNLPSKLCQGQLCTAVIQQSFIDASTTIVSIKSPFLKATTTDSSEVVLFTDDGGQAWTAVTSTVDLASLRITGAATTSYAVACAGSATAGAILPFYESIVTTTVYAVATSSIGLIENDLSALQGALIGSGTVSKITLNSAKPWLVCAVDPSIAAGFTNALNTFDGKITARFLNAR